MIKNSLRTPLFFLSLMILSVPAAAGQWLHVVVEEGGSEETLRVNVPLSLAKLLAPVIEEEAGGDLSTIEINDRDLTVEELREIWEKVKAEGDYQLASLQSSREDVVVALEGDYLIVRSRQGSRHQIDVRIPTPIVDALLSGTSGRLNIRAALDALSGYADEEFTLVSVVDGNDRARMRVWISGESAQ